METTMSWQTLEEQQPELAAFGVERLNGEVAYLATTRNSGAPRVHPITPIVGHGHLFAFMEPTSPKGHDLRRDGRYALHCGVSDTSGGAGEFSVSGTARLVDEPTLRVMAVALASYAPAERYVLFEFGVDSAESTTYSDNKPERRQWKRDR
jgi:hypothetical protein